MHNSFAFFDPAISFLSSTKTAYEITTYNCKFPKGSQTNYNTYSIITKYHTFLLEGEASKKNTHVYYVTNGTRDLSIFQNTPISLKYTTTHNHENIKVMELSRIKLVLVKLPASVTPQHTSSTSITPSILKQNKKYARILSAITTQLMDSSLSLYHCKNNQKVIPINHMLYYQMLS